MGTVTGTASSRALASGPLASLVGLRAVCAFPAGPGRETATAACIRQLWSIFAAWVCGSLSALALAMPILLSPGLLLTPAAPLEHHAVSFPLKVNFGACCGCSESSKHANTAHCVTPCQPSVCEESATSNVSRWYFGVSTGHAASTTFSTKMCFEDDRKFSPISWQFEGRHNYGDHRTAHGKYGLKAWYESVVPDEDVLKTSSGSEAASLVRTVLLPDMALQAGGSKTVVDLGHHVNLGLIEPLRAQLSPRVRFIRIIRSRFDTVRSFMGEGKVPCSQTEGMFTLCPMKHPDIALPVARITWAKLSDAQSILWFIDEVEARWQRLRRAHPILAHLTVNWCTGDQLKVAWQTVADYIGEGHLSPKSCPPRVHDKYNISDEELSSEDAEYYKHMAYSLSDLEMLKDVQRPNDCADREVA